MKIPDELIMRKLVQIIKKSKKFVERFIML